MVAQPYPQAKVTLSSQEARRYLLAYHALWPPYSLTNKGDILAYIRRVGCIQFDPINVVGRNPDLVLQSRYDQYSPTILEELLYQDRLLWDGRDKVQSIYRTNDWPYFSRMRAQNTAEPWHDHSETTRLHAQVLEAIRQRGPLCSLDLEHVDSVPGFWGVPMRTGRGALENLYTMGRLGVHHRVGSRRYFDLIERLLPSALLNRPDPFENEEAYQDWHVLRRVGGLGLAQPTGAESWLGLLKIKAPERRSALLRLAERGLIQPITIAEQPDNRVLFTPTSAFSAVMDEINPPPRPQAAFIAPLDNFLWQRDLLRTVYNFDYTWEVYKPAAIRQYGFYVLPVLYGDRFVARCDMVVNHKTRALELRGWWWENDVELDADLLASVVTALQRFMDAMGADHLETPLEIPALAPVFELARECV